MSQFSYGQYQSAVNAAQNRSSNVKVGFFKLANDADEALVRINLADVNEMQFASVHTVSAAGKWLKISCLSPFGTKVDDCELCKAVAEGNTAISKASKKVYVQMLVAYKDPTGQWSAPVPVVWERPAGFSRELANLLRDYGDLRTVILKITRNGKAGDMKTTYSMIPANPAVFKPEMIPADFSAFTNFKINKHSYWEKTPEEIHTFLTTGSFPEVERTEAPVSVASVAATYGQAPTYATPTPTAPAYSTPVQPATQSTTPTTPTNNGGFGGFSF